MVDGLTSSGTAAVVVVVVGFGRIVGWKVWSFHNRNWQYWRGRRWRLLQIADRWALRRLEHVVGHLRALDPQGSLLRVGVPGMVFVTGACWPERRVCIAENGI